MSFSQEYKEELWEEEPPRKPCCRRALSTGLLFCAQVEDGAFSLRLSGTALGDAVASFLEKQLHTAVKRSSGVHVGRPYETLTLFSPSAYARLQRADMSDLPLSVVLGFDCEQCTRYFLRGVMIAAASMTDPSRAHHLEISCRDSATARRLAALLGELDMPPKSIKRSDGMHLYYKKGSEIEDVLSYLHAHRAYFSLVNSTIEHEIRNNENRATNCVAQNIQKAVRAAAEQQSAIEILRASNAWDRLPEALRSTAHLRIEHPDATLAELAALHNPPITKSGLNHRLQKLTTMAAELQETNH